MTGGILTTSTHYLSSVARSVLLNCTGGFSGTALQWLTFKYTAVTVLLSHGHACESSPNPCQCQKKQITLSQHWRWSRLRHLSCTDSTRKLWMVTPPNNRSVDSTRPTQFHTNWESLRWRGDKLKCQFFPGTDKTTSVFHSSQLHQVVLIYLQREVLTSMQWLVW